MNSLEDLLVFPNYTNLEIKVSYPKLDDYNNNSPKKLKRNISHKNLEAKIPNETIFNTLLEMKKVLKSSIFNDEKHFTYNFM